MEKNHILIVLIIVCSGLLGGTTNFLMLYDFKLNNKECWLKFLSSIFLSVSAAFTVPLFLQILSNNILDQLSFKNALVFTGFCVLAAFFSKRYLEDLYLKVKNLERQIGKQEQQTSNELIQSAKKTEAVNKKIDDLEESIEEFVPEELPIGIRDAILGIEKISLSGSDEKKIMNTLFSNKFSWRTIEGISKESGIEFPIIAAVLEHLRDYGFAESKTGLIGQTLWRILKHPIKIYSANYGVPGNFTDISDKINGMITDNIFQGIASQAFFGIQDPKPGVGKVLKIHYRLNGKEKDLTVDEGYSFSLK
jgi:hypothetical protein